MRMRRAIACILAVAMMLIAASPALAGTATYVYDDAGRLTGLKSGEYDAADYSYDPVGNILGRDTYPPDISASPASVDFGGIANGSSSSPVTVTISNNGTLPLNIGTALINGTDSSQFSIQTDNCSGQSVSPSGSCTVDVFFSPSSLGAKSANLVVPSDDPDTPALPVPLSGTGLDIYDLTAAVAGTGFGNIVSVPSGISCGSGGSDCSENYTGNTQVTLTAVADPGAVFTGWSGGGCSGTGECVVTMNADTTVTAAFEDLHSLSVMADGTGSGGVVSTPSGISCGLGGSDCDELYGAGTEVTLIATPDYGSSFAGWSGGGCSGTGQCVVTVNADTSVTASFEPGYTLTASLAGTGFGNITSAPSGVTCGSGFTSPAQLTIQPSAMDSFMESLYPNNNNGTSPVFQIYNHTTNRKRVPLRFDFSELPDVADISNAVITLYKQSNGPPRVINSLDLVRLTTTTWTETGVTWNCAEDNNNDGICDASWTSAGGDFTTSNMASIASVNCYADTGPWEFTVTDMIKWFQSNASEVADVMWKASEDSTDGEFCVVHSNNSATLESRPKLVIDYMASDCTETYAVGTSVTLSAEPEPGSTFTGWTGGGCSGTGQCMVTMNADTSVTATFDEFYNVSLTLQGTGLGNVVSAPSGIDCGSGTVNDCIEAYADGTQVTLMASPDMGSFFDGWSGVGCGGVTNPCILDVVIDSPVYAEFNSGEPSSDISVTLNDNSDPVILSKDITYSIEIENNGPDTATGVTLSDTLPMHVTFVSASSSQGTCSESTGIVTCNVGEMANGAVVTVTVVVSTPSPGIQTNSVSASSTTADPNSSNDSASENTAVTMVNRAHMGFQDSGTDIGYFHPSTGEWLIDFNYDGIANKTAIYGATGDVPVPANYNGTTATDMAFFRPSEGKWYVDNNLDGISEAIVTFGAEGDVPTPGLYNGTGLNLTVFRPSNGTWYIDTDWDGTVDYTIVFGDSGDVPVPGDYNNDGWFDIAIFRPSNGNWYIDIDLDGLTDIQVNGFGANGDIPVSADYSGSDETDIAIFRPSTGTWYIDTDFDGITNVQVNGFGMEGDIPVPDDHDGDGKVDIAVFRSSNGTWYIDTNLDGVANITVNNYGTPGDIPF